MKGVINGKEEWTWGEETKRVLDKEYEKGERYRRRRKRKTKD